jgi:hypothetical protein
MPPMPQRLHRSLVVSVCAVVCAAITAMSLWSLSGHVRTADRNGDGRLDIWHIYDSHGRPLRVVIDSNFDGRADVHEYFERGAFVRREADRDFNDRIDLVQEFDPTTREHARSLIDVDFDGSADLFVLFRGGQPVLSKWVHLDTPVSLRTDSALHHSVSPRTARSQLAPLTNPFAGDLAVRGVRVTEGCEHCVGLSSSGGLPTSRTVVPSPLVVSSNASESHSDLSTAAVLQYSPRGPPLSHLFS